MKKWMMAILAMVLLVLSAVSQGCSSGGESTVTITVNGQGTTDPAGDSSWKDGATVAVTASPDPFWKFDEWSGDASGAEYAFTFTIEGNMTFVAHFSLNYQTWTLVDETIGVPPGEEYRYGWGFNEAIMGIPPGQHYAQSHSFVVTAATMQDVTVSGTFAVTSTSPGDQVEVLILDDANFLAIRTGGSWTALYSLGPTTKGTLNVPITTANEGATRFWIIFVDFSSKAPSLLRVEAKIYLKWTGY